MEYAEIKGEHSNMFTLILDEDSGVAVERPNPMNNIFINEINCKKLF